MTAVALSEALMQLEQFPAPWGVKWAVEARGVVQATFSQPVAEHRMKQGREFIEWFQAWLPAAMQGGA